MDKDIFLIVDTFIDNQAKVLNSKFISYWFWFYTFFSDKMVGEEKVFKLTEVEKHNISKGENKECFQKKYSIIYKDNSMNWFLCL